MKFVAFQNPAIFSLLNKLFSASLPVKVAYRLSKVQKVITLESEKYQELRMGIIKKYARTNEDGELAVDESGNAKIDDDNVENLVQEMNDLHDIEFDLPLKIKIEELQTIELTAYDLSVLEELEVLEE